MDWAVCLTQNKELIMTVTKNHSVKLTTSQMSAVKELMDWYLERSKNKEMVQRLSGKREALKNARAIFDYSLKHPDFKF